MARSKSDATKPVDMLDELAEQFSARYNPHSRWTMLVKKHSIHTHFLAHYSTRNCARRCCYKGGGPNSGRLSLFSWIPSVTFYVPFFLTAVYSSDGRFVCYVLDLRTLIRALARAGFRPCLMMKDSPKIRWESLVRLLVQATLDQSG